jgi:hypothetical protein
LDKRLNGWTDGCIGGWMDGWMDGLVKDKERSVDETVTASLEWKKNWRVFAKGEELYFNLICTTLKNILVGKDLIYLIENLQ